MKTDLPLIVTARIAANDLEPFERLRQQHFPVDRNHIRAHVTMFHRLPGEYVADVCAQLAAAAKAVGPITADINGIRHLGAGVAFTIASPDLQDVRAGLKAAFGKWLVSQDAQKWQPHITVQNKVSKLTADTLYHELRDSFRPHSLEFVGMDLWQYLGGPWRHEAGFDFTGSRPIGLVS